jgi:hypothetical protein
MQSEFFKLENKLADQLSFIKDKSGLFAVKAEFEAEGASFRDLIRLRVLTARKNVRLYLKIGGVEALRDIKDAMELGVDGLIAPMVESPFGVMKFVGAVEAIFSQRKLFKSINIETRTAVDNIDAILEVARDKIDNVTIGRTDLSLSYFDPSIKPDSPFIFDLIEQLSHKIQSSGLALTVGGSLTNDSICLFKDRQEKLGDRLFSMETRKIIFSTNRMLDHKNSLKEALLFEEIYLRFKLQSDVWFSRLEQERLDKLKTRV